MLYTTVAAECGAIPILTLVVAAESERAADQEIRYRLCVWAFSNRLHSLPQPTLMESLPEAGVGQNGRSILLLAMADLHVQSRMRLNSLVAAPKACRVAPPTAMQVGFDSLGEQIV